VSFLPLVLAHLTSRTALVAEGLQDFVPTVIGLFVEVERWSWHNWVFAGVGFLYLPMALLCASLGGSLDSVSPLRVIPQIRRSGWRYGVVCVALGVGAWVYSVLADLVPDIVVVRSLLTNAMNFYFLILASYLIGQIFLADPRRFPWCFAEPHHARARSSDVDRRL
jgi:hypothetical protein